MPRPTARDIKFATIMSGVTTLVVSFVLLMVNAGFRPGFFFIWMRSWAIAAVLVALSILFVAPLIRKYLIK